MLHYFWCNKSARQTLWEFTFKDPIYWNFNVIKPIQCHVILHFFRVGLNESPVRASLPNNFSSLSSNQINLNKMFEPIISTNRMEHYMLAYPSSSSPISVCRQKSWASKLYHSRFNRNQISPRVRWPVLLVTTQIHKHGQKYNFPIILLALP